MTKIKASIIILSLIMIGCKDNQSQEGSLQNQEDSCQFWDLSKNMATGKEH